MTLVLDSGGVSALATSRARLAAIADRAGWPALVPVVVLAEALTGDHRRDVAVNRLLRTCVLLETTEDVARAAALLRTATGRAGTVSAVAAIVAAHAIAAQDPVVLTSDPRDLMSLVAQSDRPVRVSQV